MESQLSSGDRSLIDVSRMVPVPPGILVIWDGLGIVAMRSEHAPHADPPRVVLQSLNTACNSHESPAEQIGVGRAVWISRKLQGVQCLLDPHTVGIAPLLVGGHCR